MAALATIFDYLREFAPDLGRRITEAYQPLHKPGDPVSPLLSKLKRKALPAQALAIMGTVKFWQKGGRAAKMVAECGTGKTLMSIASCYVHAAGKRFTAIAMCPPHLPKKWAREVFMTLPNVRVFIVYDMRNNGNLKLPHGMTEVVYEKGKIVHKGLKVTLSELRRMGPKGFAKMCPENSFFIMSKEKGKLGYFWKHAYEMSESGPNNGSVIGIDSGLPIETSTGGNLTRMSFDTNKYDETVERPSKGTTVFSPLWQADNKKLQRMAPLDYMGRYMKGFFDYAIADELHQLAGDTAQGNGLAVLERIARKLIGLTGTMMGGYADDLYNILYRMDAPQMAQDGYAWGGEGRSVFQGTYGVCEEIVKRYTSDNACSKASKASVTIKRKPGCSPLLFGKYLMENTAFVSLADIAANLPAYNESVIPVEMDAELSKAYTDILEAIKKALEEYPRNPSLTSLMLNTLLCYPDHPFGFDSIYGKIKDKMTGNIQVVHVCDPAELDRNKLYPKEQALLDDVKEEIAAGRRVQVFATFTGRHDVTARLKYVFEQAGLRTAVLKSSVGTDVREAWYEARLKEGVQVVICHPKLVETGLDLLAFSTIYFYEVGYSLFTLRQASRRSWRIGQKDDVRVKFLMYSGTVQENQIRLMGRKLLVSLCMEGKFSGEGLDGFEEDDDMVTSMVRELLEEGKVGESADAVWANLARERDRIQSFEQTPLMASEEQEVETTDSSVPLDDSSAFAFDAAEEEVSEVEEAEPLPEVAKPFLVPTPAPVPVSIPEPAPVSQTNVLAFNAMHPKARRRKPIVEDEEQMLLFG
jgi:hypothetical protein